MTSDELLHAIYSRCEPQGECMLWQDAVDATGVPIMRIPGDRARGTISVRRVLLQDVCGHDLSGLLATFRCTNSACLAPKHVVGWTRKQLQLRSGKKLHGNLQRNAKIATISRERNGKLSTAKVALMRAERMTATQAAALFGVAPSTAGKALNGRAWKNYGDPFAQLMALAA